MAIVQSWNSGDSTLLPQFSSSKNGVNREKRKRTSVVKEINTRYIVEHFICLAANVLIFGHDKITYKIT